MTGLKPGRYTPVSGLLLFFVSKVKQLVNELFEQNGKLNTNGSKELSCNLIT